jgi:hypothetical protein
MKRCMSLQVLISGKASLADVTLEWLVWCILQARISDGRHINLESRRERELMLVCSRLRIWRWNRMGNGVESEMVRLSRSCM